MFRFGYGVGGEIPGGLSSIGYELPRVTGELLAVALQIIFKCFEVHSMPPWRDLFALSQAAADIPSGDSKFPIDVVFVPERAVDWIPGVDLVADEPGAELVKEVCGPNALDKLALDGPSARDRYRERETVTSFDSDDPRAPCRHRWGPMAKPPFRRQRRSHP